MTEQPVGIRDVARAVGISVSAVSLALNGRPGVSVETRHRVLAVAAELGYRANPQAQALRRGRSSTYGLMVRNLSNPFFLEVLAGAEEIGAEARATVLMLDSRYSLDHERALIKEMAAQRLAGLAIAPVGTGDSLRLWQQLRPGTPLVALNGCADGLSGVSRVRPDAAAAVGLPMRRLAELGHRAVAFVCAPAALLPDPDRLGHFERLASELGIRPYPMHTPLTIEDVRLAARALLTRPDPPTAFITNSDYTAGGIYKAARDLSLQVGRHVSVVGHDDLPTSELLDPPLATVRLDGRAMGRALMARLIGRERTDYTGPVELVERASLGTP
ncbi:MAG TPA: LacI family DNA-binding transcriptional regulator [Trebonia sp.]|nr:LacI family DNA-binding transcriptional regulator [Trebonia sp.]